METTIVGKIFKGLLDMGTSHFIVSSVVAKNLGLEVTKEEGDIKNVNSAPTPIVEMAHKVNVCMGEWSGPVDMTVVGMDDFEVVIGLEFLDQMKAVLVPYVNTMCFLEGKACTVPIQWEKALSKKILSAMQFSKGVRRHEPTYIVAAKVEEGLPTEEASK